MYVFSDHLNTINLLNTNTDDHKSSGFTTNKWRLQFKLSPVTKGLLHLN